MFLTVLKLYFLCRIPVSSVILVEAAGDDGYSIIDMMNSRDELDFQSLNYRDMETGKLQLFNNLIRCLQDVVKTIQKKLVTGKLRRVSTRSLLLLSDLIHLLIDKIKKGEIFKHRSRENGSPGTFEICVKCVIFFLNKKNERPLIYQERNLIYNNRLELFKVRKDKIVENIYKTIVIAMDYIYDYLFK